MNKSFIIGTRKSSLALIQAGMVQKKLMSAGFGSLLNLITTEGDQSQASQKPFMEGTGIFTKAIDEALLAGEADIGVHSLKDMPPVLHEDLVIAAVLDREDPSDVLVVKNQNYSEQKNNPSTIATASLRRKAQWLNRYPADRIVPVRGNIDSRLTILNRNPWDGMILAAAGLIRMQSVIPFRKLDWMVPAPGQGIIAMVIKKNNINLFKILSSLGDRNTMVCATLEKEFLSYLGTGCSVPVGALATINKNKINFSFEILDLSGSRKIKFEIEENIDNSGKIIPAAVIYAKKNGADELLRSS